MITLQIEHPVPDYTTWKSAFDGDPIDRAGSGVVGYRIGQPVDNDHYVVIELDFVTSQEADAALGKLEALWANVTVTGGVSPTTRMLEVMDVSDAA